MRVVTPFDLVEMFPEKQRLIFVGNAPSLTGSHLGSWIDSHDVVVRFNECPLAGFASDVGERTDILVTNPYPENRPPMLDGRSARLVLVIAPETRRGDKSVFASWVGDHDVLFTYTPDLVGVGGVDHRAGLTTGTYAVQLIWRLLRPARMACTGFTMFLDDTAAHYWRNSAPAGLQKHDVEAEARVFIQVLNSVRSRLEVTEEVAWVSNRIGVPLKPAVQVVKLPTDRWRQ
jgi:Glycosyltransferase family 29 (sialyltransferase)